MLESTKPDLDCCDKIKQKVLLNKKASFKSIFRSARTALVHDFHQIKVDAALILAAEGRESPGDAGFVPISFWDSSSKTFGGFNDYARLKYQSILKFLVAPLLKDTNLNKLGCMNGPLYSLNATLGEFLADSSGLFRNPLSLLPFKVSLGNQGGCGWEVRWFKRFRFHSPEVGSSNPAGRMS